MTSSEKDKSTLGEITDQLAMREIWPGCGDKRLAREMKLPLLTSKHWRKTKVSTYRRREWALAMLRVMDRQDLMRQQIREYLEPIAGYPNGEVGMLGTVRSALADRVGNAAAGVEVAARWLAEKASR
jgi:hypothetical protein